MTDTPDVIDTLFPDVRERPLMDLDGTTTYEPTRTLYTAESIRKILAAAGYVLVKAPGLSHGDELVRVDGLRVTGTQDAPTFNQQPVWRRLRRSVPERRCSTCDGRKVVEGHAWRRIDETTGFPARELVPCPACSVPENGGRR